MWVDLARLRPTRLMVAIALGMVIVAGSVMFGIDFAVNKAVSMDARTKAEDWAKYFIEAMPDLDPLLAGGKMNTQQQSLVSTAAKIGNVFRFKLYDAKGTAILESDPERFDKDADEDEDHIEDEALDVVRDKQSMVSLNDGKHERNMPSLYAEAYVPVLKENGELRAIVETYVDQTKTADFFKTAFASLAVALGLGTALAFGIPTFAYLVSTKQARKVKHEAELMALARDAAEKSEAEALSAAARFKALNESVTTLNIQLHQKAEELQSAQEEIVRKGKLAQLGMLIATVAHELRNPLGAMRATNFLLKKRMESASAETTKLLARIDSGIVRCDNIISELLDYSRSEPLDTAATDVDSWLAAVLTDQAADLPAEIDINCELGLGGSQANIDPVRMRRAIMNLVENSVEAMTRKGQSPVGFAGRPLRIDARTKLTPRGAEITIEDNGPGIPPELLAKIREPLFTTKGFGTGLGLPAVEKIVELHGGGLELESEPGRGARFTIWIPGSQGPASGRLI